MARKRRKNANRIKAQPGVLFATNEEAKITNNAQPATADQQLTVAHSPQKRKLNVPFIVDNDTPSYNEQRPKKAKSVQQFIPAGSGQQLETFTKQPAENSECRTATINFDKYRVRYEAEDHWELRRCFLEKNYQSIPEDELAGIAQLFMNIELLHCRYPPETMARVAQFSAGVSEEFRRNRRHVPLAQRTFVAASKAAACKVQRKTLDLNSLCNGAPGLGNNTHDGPKPYTVIPCPKTLDEILHNIIVLNNSYNDTANAFNRLNCGSKFDCNVSSVNECEYVACVKVGKFVIAQVKEENCLPKAVQKRVQVAAMEYLSERCHSLLRKKQITQLDGISVIPKSTTKDQTPDTGNEEKKSDATLGKLDNSNIGFKLMQKLGWTGGSLGSRGDGMINPVEVMVKKGRNGLGHANTVHPTSMNNIKEQLMALRSGVAKVDYLVFSAEFKKSDRATIHGMAHQLGLSTKSIGQDKLGTRQLVVEAAPLSPFEKLNKVLIEKDPFYCEMFEVRPPCK